MISMKYVRITAAEIPGDYKYSAKAVHGVLLKGQRAVEARCLDGVFRAEEMKGKQYGTSDNSQ